MTKTEMKRAAQSELLSRMQCAFDTTYEDKSPELLAEMDQQMRRVEKMFGYVPGSWARGA